MKRFGLAILFTLLIFFSSIFIVAPIIAKIGYSSVEGSYHAVTHAILFSLICTVIFCAMTIVEAINNRNRN